METIGKIPHTGEILTRVPYRISTFVTWLKEDKYLILKGEQPQFGEVRHTESSPHLAEIFCVFQKLKRQETEEYLVIK